MAPVAGGLAGTAFFPAGRGLVRPGDTTISAKPVMVLGQDFGTVSYVEGLSEAGRTEEVRSVTWRELADLLPKSGIGLDECFFTNAYMGLRVEGPMVGALRARKHATYRAWCEEFFGLQLQTQRPRMIVVLGMQPAYFLAEMFSELSAWKEGVSYKRLQEGGAQVKRFGTVYGPVAAVVIPHPSFLHANGHRCAWKEATGRPALERMLADVWKVSTTMS